RAAPRAIWRGLRGGAIAGIFLWMGYVFQTLGLKYTSAGNSGFLTGLYIVLVPLISAAVYRRWPHARELIGIAVAASGVVVLTVPSLDRNFQINRGDLLTLPAQWPSPFTFWYWAIIRSVNGLKRSRWGKSPVPPPCPASRS